MSVVPALAPGAESASGIAALLELARLFAARPPARTVYFLATSGHHTALQGVREFLHSRLDAWAQPGFVERVRSREGRGPAVAWLALLSAGFAMAWMRGGRARRRGLTWAAAAACLVFVALGASLLAAPSGPLRRPPGIYLWTGLDLTSRSRGVGLFYKGSFYDIREDVQTRFSEIARVTREHAAQVGETLGFDAKRTFADGVNVVTGKSWRNFLPGYMAFDAEAVTMANGVGFTFCSVDDARPLVDTPFDTAERMNLDNLGFQVRLLACLFHHFLNDSNRPDTPRARRMPLNEPSSWSRLALTGGFGTLNGRVTMFNPRKSFIAYPDERIAGALAVVRNTGPPVIGVRSSMIQITRAGPRGGNGFEFHGIAPLTAYTARRKVEVAAYKIDDRRMVPSRLPRPTPMRPNPYLGEIIYAPDRGPTGAKWMPLDVSMSTDTKEAPITLFRCMPTAIYDLVDQQALRGLSTMEVLDGDTNGEPRMYGYDFSPPDPTGTSSYSGDAAVVYSQPGTRLKLVMGAGPGAVRLLLLNPGPGAPEGEGYLVAGDPADRQDADLSGSRTVGRYDPAREIARGGAIYHTALHAARDLWELDEFRLNRMRRNGIVNEGVDGLHRLAKQSLTAAEQALKEKDWERFYALSREAWGFEARAYPLVQQTATDVVKGALFYLALLIPFAFLMERLLIGAYDLKRQLGYSLLIFLAVFLVFSQIHPAFDITMSPVIVLLAFVMLALSCIVIALLAGKFEENLKRAYRERTGVHQADIGRVSVALAAFSLGIANMRRRKLRTLLTCVTLVLLTFTTLCFTSIVDSIRFNQIPAAGTPRYNGLLVRTASWSALQEPAYRLLEDEYGARHRVAPRAWIYSVQSGEQSHLTLRRGDRQYDARGAAGLSAAESEITRPQEALVAGRWFQPGDVNAVILPSSIADPLGIDSRDVGKATVTYAGSDFAVIGILGTSRLRQVTDLDNEVLTPVDFVLAQKLLSRGAMGSEAGFHEYVHLAPDASFFIPFDTAMSMGASLRSVAIDLDDPAAVAKSLGPLMRRLDMNLYAGRIPTDGTRPYVERFSSLATTSGRGLEMVLIPVLISALIVLNTMLGSVYERVREIHIFSSVGLAPSHIAMLFMAEAMVYTILGAVAGYLVAQMTAKALAWSGAFQGLYLNFSSTSTILSTLVVSAVVLLSTLYPAKKAAEVATPAIDRSWQVDDPTGDEWTIPLPFSVTQQQASGLSLYLAEWLGAYEDYNVGDLVTQDVRHAEILGEGGAVGYRVTSMAWIVPFDLGVSQRVTIEALPLEMDDVLELRVRVERVTGDMPNWIRANRRFLNNLRKQFLIWRTLKQADRERYRESPGETLAVIDGESAVTGTAT